MGDDDFGIYNFNFQKNMSAAVEICTERHENATLPYYQCLCSGLTSESFSYTRYKYYFCKKAASLEKEESAQHMKAVGETVGIVLGVCVLLFLLIFIYRKFKVQIKRCLSAAFSNMGMRQHYESCSRMFCVCCQKHPKSRLDELPANQNLSGRPSSGCGRCCYSDTFLGIMEFLCDCDCFRTKRAPKYLMPIIGKPKPKERPDGDGGEIGEFDEPMVELQPPRRMRSVRKAPPPPGPPRGSPAGASAPPDAPVLPDAPGFDPEKREFGTGKRRAPGPPPAQTPYQPEYQQPYQQPYHATPQQYSGPPPQYGQLHFQEQPPPQQHQQHQQHHQPPQQQQQQPLNRGGPLRVSKEFTAQLNQAMVGRRWPSESEI